MGTSLKQLVDKVQHFVDNHSILGDMIYNSLYKVDVIKGRKYPILVMTPQPFYIKDTSIQYVIDFFVADILDGEESNLADVHSDTIQICVDLVAYFSTLYGVEDWDLRLDESSVYMEPAAHVLDNEVAGMFMQCTFIAPLPLNYCANPVN